MARINFSVNDMINGWGEDVDFYFLRGRPVARSWPRHVKFPYTEKQAKAQLSFKESRKAIKVFPAALRNAWQSFFYGNKRAWVDFFTSNFVKYFMKYNIVPPLVSDVGFEYDYENVYLVFKTSECKPVKLYLFDTPVKNFSVSKLTHGGYDVCYKSGFPSPKKVFDSLPCYGKSNVVVPFQWYKGFRKDFQVGPEPCSMHYSTVLSDFYKSLNNRVISYNVFLNTMKLEIEFQHVVMPEGWAQVYGYYYTIGHILQLDENYISYHHLFDQFDFLLLEFHNPFFPMVYPFRDNPYECHRPFVSFRVNGVLYQFINDTVKVKITKEFLEAHNYRIAVYYDILSFNPDTLFKSNIFPMSQTYSFWASTDWISQLKIYGVQKVPSYRFAIPRSDFKKGFWVALSDANQEYFLLPPFNLLELANICNSKFISPAGSSARKPLPENVSYDVSDFFSDNSPVDILDYN